MSGVSLTRATDSTHGSTGDATKRFVDATISIAPDAVNAVGQPHTFTVTVMQDVWVLSVVDDIGRPTTRDVRELPPEGKPVQDKEPGPSELLSSSATITVAVRPSDAQRLTLAQTMGDLTVSLRSLWETPEQLTLDHATMASTLGLVQQVRARRGRSYRVIE